jgi:hypothetical protein
MCLLWTPVRVRYYVSKYRSDDIEQITYGIKGLLSVGHKGEQKLVQLVSNEFSDGLTGRQVQVVDILITYEFKRLGLFSKILGEGGKEAAFLIKYWTNYNKPMPYNTTPYHDYRTRYPLNLAAKNGFSDAIILMVFKSADVEVKSQYGWTPLFYATRNGETEIAAFLIEQGADVNARGSSGQTPLHQAALNRNKDIAAMLLEKGADVNPIDRYGCTPLNSGYTVSSEDFGKGQEAREWRDRRDKTNSLLRSYGAKTREELKKESEKK